jgi:hypothetical protein
MKKMMPLAVLAAVLVTAGLTGAAQAQRHGGGGFHGGGFHGGFGGGFRGSFFVGGPFLYDPFWYDPYWDYYYPWYDTAYYSPYPYYYPPNSGYGPYGPTATPQQGWYYCSNPQGYYPSVPNCNSQWQFVPPRPQQPPPQ